MPKVLVVGDVIDDILVSPNSPIRIDTDTNADIISNPGGSGANFACWLASCGVDTSFVGRVGHTDVARQSSILESYGVKPFLQADPDLQTGKIVVLLEGQNRSFLTDRGANKNLDLAQIPDELFGDALYISGYSVFDQDPEDIRNLIGRARDRGIVICDPGSAGYIYDHGVNAFLDAIDGVDLLVPSLEEGRVLTSEDQPEHIAGQLATRFSLVALTLGEGGVQLAWGDNNLLISAFDADLVDTTGAGDAFAAKFLTGLLSMQEPEVAAKEANRLAAKAVSSMGGRPLAK